MVAVSPVRVSSLETADDRTLAGRAADGDVRAFTVLVRRHSPLLKAHARRLLGRSDEVDDVVQEAFIAAWAQLSSLKDPGLVKSWLMRTVSYKSIDRIRARRDHDDIGDHEPQLAPQLSPESVIVAQSREDALAGVLSQLPPQQRQCWLLKESSGLSYEEIAEALAVPLSTVRGLLARARKTVITEMEPWR